MPRPGTKPPTKITNALANERIEAFSYFNDVDIWLIKLVDMPIPITRTTEEFEHFIDTELSQHG